MSLFDPKVKKILFIWQAAMTALHEEEKEPSLSDAEFFSFNEEKGILHRKEDKTLYVTNSIRILNFLAQVMISRIEDLLKPYENLYLAKPRSAKALYSFWTQTYKPRLKYLGRKIVPFIESQALYEKSLLLKWLLHHLTKLINTEDIIPITYLKTKILKDMETRGAILNEQLSQYTQIQNIKPQTLDDIEAWIEQLLTPTNKDEKTISSAPVLTPPTSEMRPTTPPLVETLADPDNSTSVTRDINQLNGFELFNEFANRLNAGLLPANIEEDPCYPRLVEIITEQKALLQKKLKRYDQLYTQCQDLKNNKVRDTNTEDEVEKVAQARLVKLTEVRDKLKLEIVELQKDIKLLELDKNLLEEILLRVKRKPAIGEFPAEQKSSTPISKKSTYRKQPLGMKLLELEPHEDIEPPASICHTPPSPTFTQIRSQTEEAENRVIFIQEIEQYIKQRDQKDMYGSMFSRLGGYSCKDKTQAWEKLLDYLHKEPVEFTKTDIGALTDSKSFRLIKAYASRVTLPPAIVATIKSAKRDYHQEFIDELWKYILDRNKEAVANKNNYQHFYSGLSGFDAHTKTRAADKLVKLLKNDKNNDNITFSFEEISALRADTLGDIVKKFEKMTILPDEFVRADKERITMKVLKG